jgi:hypothetical protein
MGSRFWAFGLDWITGLDTTMRGKMIPSLSNASRCVLSFASRISDDLLPIPGKQPRLSWLGMSY